MTANQREKSDAWQQLSRVLEQPDVPLDTLLSLLLDVEIAEIMEAITLCVTYLQKEGRGYRVEAFLGAAAQHGVCGLESIQVHHCPQVLTTAQLWELTNVPSHVFAARSELCKRGDDALLAEHERQLAAAIAERRIVDVAPILTLVLGLQSAANVEAADRLLGLLVSYLEATGTARELHPRCSFQLQVAKELAGLPEGASAFRSIVARAMFGPEPSAAEGPLASMARSDPNLARGLRRLLSQGRPVLQHLYSPSLAPTKRGRHWEWLTVVLVVVVVRLVARATPLRTFEEGLLKGQMSGAPYWILLGIAGVGTAAYVSYRVRAAWRSRRNDATPK